MRGSSRAPGAGQSNPVEEVCGGSVQDRRKFELLLDQASVTPDWNLLANRDLMINELMTERKANWVGRETDIPIKAVITVRGEVNGVEVPIVLDTGAQVTVMSEAVYKLLDSPALTHIDATTTGASGDRLEVLGALPVTFKFNGAKFPFRVWVVRGLRSNILLGQDFGQVYSMNIETRTPKVAIEGQSVQVLNMIQARTEKSKQKQPTVQVIAWEDIVIPQNSLLEVLAKARVPISQLWSEGEVLIWSKERPDQLCVSQTVKLGKELEGAFPLRVANFGVNQVRVSKGQLLGSVIFLGKEVNIHSIDVSDQQVGKCESGAIENTGNNVKEQVAVGTSMIPVLTSLREGDPDPEPGQLSVNGRRCEQPVPNEENDVRKKQGSRPAATVSQYRVSDKLGVGKDQKLSSKNDDSSEFVIQLQDMLGAKNASLEDEKRKQLLALLLEFEDILKSPKLGEVKGLEYDIEVPPWETPVKQNDRRWSVQEIQLIKNEISKLLEGKFIEPAQGPWSSRLVLVPKPDGSTRVCVDYRGINEKTMTDAYPTPRVDHILETLSGNMWFSTMDAEKGYYQVRITERTKSITAFTCPFGHYQWSHMPFGLKNAPAVFQRMMDGIEGTNLAVVHGIL